MNNDRPAEATAVTKPTVTPGLGYPNNRLEESPEQIGWQGITKGEIDHVSRETSEEESNY